MSEIAKIPHNGFVVASTFSGCGGSSLGYKMAGFKVAWANEFVKAAQETYRENHPSTYLDTRDIRTIEPTEILKEIDADGIDILDGSPPCAAFSTAGTREQGWSREKAYSDVRQRVDDLFFEFVRILEGVRPRVFVVENVTGLVKGKAKGYFLEILRALRSSGYRVECRSLDAQWLGVPQQRKRTIFIGVREDLQLSPVFPDPLPYRYTIREILPHLRRIQAGSYCAEWLNTHRPMGTITQSDGARAHRSQCETKGGIRRKFTIDELKAICGFPEDFVLTGSYAQQWERLGRAVPPPMMQSIAETIEKNILRKVTDESG